MNMLVFNQGRRYVSYSLMTEDNNKPVLSGKLAVSRNSQTDQNLLGDIQACLSEQGILLDGIGLRINYGGQAFPEATLVSKDVIATLWKIAPYAPLHIPPAIRLIENCQQVFADTSILLTFETAFFVDLPQREYLYAIDEKHSGVGAIRRYGYHGLYHEAACHDLQQRWMGEKTQKIISICLEPRSEIAAVVGMRPVMVTSGTTPLEGLPGETSCGELDPSVILTIAEKEGYGPEEINTILTQQSGIKGILGESKKLDELLLSNQAQDQLAVDVLHHRLLLACGAAIAAMDGLDRIVFSGRYADLGKTLGTWLKSKIKLDARAMKSDWTWTIVHKTRESIIANKVFKEILKKRYVGVG